MKNQTKSNRRKQSAFTVAAIVVLLFVGCFNAAAQTTYKVGDKIEVQYGYNAWYKAEILEVKDGSYKVRYDGSGSSSDEWVKPNRMRPIGGKFPTDNQAENQPNENSRATYEVGDQIEVQYDNSWYRANVVGVKDGSYRIRYENDNTFSEQLVKPGRMRRIGDKTPPVNPNNADNQTKPTKDNQTTDKPAETIKGNKYGTRDARTCADKKAPAKGAITEAFALKYLICEREKVSGGYLYLVEDVKIQVGGGIPYNPNANLNVPDIDVRFPLYSIRGSLVSYQCNTIDERFDWRKTGKNCNKYIEPKASGSCYRTTFGEWRCHMADTSNNNENWFPGVAPPKP